MKRVCYFLWVDSLVTLHPFILTHITSVVKAVHIFMVRSRVSKSCSKADLCFPRYVHFDYVPIYKHICIYIYYIINLLHIYLFIIYLYIHIIIYMYMLYICIYIIYIYIYIYIYNILFLNKQITK